MKNTAKNKIIDGRYQMGLVTDWIMKNHNLNGNELLIFMKILYLSCNKYHKRRVAIKQDEFGLNSKTLKKYRDILTDKKIIDWKVTSGYTVYWLEQPYHLIKDFVFKDNDIEKPKVNNLFG
jgi:hypothetical protein